jgi:hypothetical protein
MFYEFPSESEWQSIIGRFPLDRLSLNRELFLPLRNDPVAGSTLNDVLHHWDTRKFALQLSYGMVLFYFQKSIPDDNWVDSSGDSGATFVYYPEFTERDHYTKLQFDYHAEAFFLKIFSCWDTIGHILNTVYELNLSGTQVRFTAAVAKLRSKNEQLFHRLDPVVARDFFVKARSIRNNYVHNYIPTTIGPSIRRVPGPVEKYEGHVGEYTTSKEIMSIVRGSLDLLVETVGYARQLCGSC